MSANPPFASVLQMLSSFVPGLRLIDGSDLQTQAKMLFQTVAGITALAGGGLTGAPVLGLGNNEVDTVATNNDSVALPPAVPGLTINVYNATGQTLAVFANGSNPNNAFTADTIIPSTTNVAAASQTIATAKVAQFFCFKAGIWKILLSS